MTLPAEPPTTPPGEPQADAPTTRAEPRRWLEPALLLVLAVLRPCRLTAPKPQPSRGPATLLRRLLSLKRVSPKSSSDTVWAAFGRVGRGTTKKSPATTKEQPPVERHQTAAAKLANATRRASYPTVKRASQKFSRACARTEFGGFGRAAF